MNIEFCKNNFDEFKEVLQRIGEASDEDIKIFLVESGIAKENDIKNNSVTRVITNGKTTSLSVADSWESYHIDAMAVTKREEHSEKILFDFQVYIALQHLFKRIGDKNNGNN